MNRGAGRDLRLKYLITFSPIFILLLYALSSLFMASKVTDAERSVPVSTPASVGLPYEQVDFTSRDSSVRLKGWYIEPERPRGVIIIVHGLDSEKADAEVGYLELARRLYERDVALLLFDLRGHGESGEGKLSGGLFEQEDLLGAFDWLVARGVEPRRIGVAGFSMGGAIALLSAAREPRLQAVIADSSFADIRDLLSTEIPKRAPIPEWLAKAFIPGITLSARLAYGIKFDEIAPERAVASLRYPLLLIHSRTDERIPFQHGLRLKAASPNPETMLWELNSIKHVKGFQSFPDEYAERMMKYLLSRWE